MGTIKLCTAKMLPRALYTESEPEGSTQRDEQLCTSGRKGKRSLFWTGRWVSLAEPGLAGGGGKRAKQRKGHHASTATTGALTERARCKLLPRPSCEATLTPVSRSSGNKMSREPLGKVLLRNVIRHTDAHNKIQEETEMWKVREMEKQSETHANKRKRESLDLNRWDHNGYKELYPEEFSDNRSRMRSDGFDAEGSRDTATGSAAAAVTLRQDSLSVRAWNKKYSECEAGMPDRWGHSGYKELYPEEFDTDSDKEEEESKRKANGQEKSRRKSQKEQESHKRKRSKKTHKKKQKKRSHKKLKKRKKQMESTESSSDSSDDSEEKPKKSKHKKKTRKKSARKRPSSSGQDSGSSSDEMSSTEDYEERKDKRTEKSSKKRHSHSRSKSRKDSETEARKNKRTNWKVAKDESSESSDED